MKKIPKSLRCWFLVHFVLDLIFAIPLIIMPGETLEFFGVHGENFLMARLVGAALLGIGGVSLLANQKGLESYNSLLSLKIIWSTAAIIAISFSIIDGAPNSVWLILFIFVVFSIVWLRYKVHLTQKS